MALKADSQGFLIGGEPINLKPEKDRLKQIADDVAAMKKAVFSRVGLKDADLKNATTSTANATAKATQKAVTNAIKTAIPRQRDSNGKFVAKTMVVSSVEKIATPRPAQATTKTATPQPRHSGGETMMVQATNKSVVAPKVIGDVASKSIGSVKGLTDRTSEIDPTVKAFQEVAEPLGRGFEFLKGGSRDDKQTSWLKKIFSSINVFRKEEFKSNKDQKTLLQDIDNKTGTGSGGGGLLGGLIAGLGGLLTKIPLIGSGLGGIGKVLGGSGGMLGGLGGLGKGMIGGAKGLLKKVPFVGALMSGLGAMTDIFSNESDTELTREEKDRKNGSAVGGAAGSVGGMMAGAAIGSMLGPIGTIVGGAVGMFLGDQGGQIIGDVVGGWVNQLRDADIAGTIIKAWESTTSMIKSGWDSLTSTIEKGWKSISDVGEKVVETAADAANTANDYIEEKTGVNVKQTVTNAATSLTNMASSAYNTAKQGATKAVETAKAGVEWVGNNTTIGKGVSAIAEGTKRIFTKDDGSTELREGGTRSWRNNNPGNVRMSEFARSNGAIGSDADGFAIFPTLDAGSAAKQKLIFEGKNYKDLSLSDAIARYAPPSENDTARYQRTVLASVGGENKKMTDYTPEERKSIIEAMTKVEGFKVGKSTMTATKDKPLLDAAMRPENPVIASVMTKPTQPIAAPNIQSVAPVQPIKTPPIPEIAPVTIPLNSMASNNPPPAPVINLDVGQDLSDRNLAHLVTGGLGGRWG